MKKYMETKTKNIVLLGAGDWGKNLARELYGLGVLRAVCDANQELLDKIQENHPGLDYYTTDFNKILEDRECTAVVVALPAVLHYMFAQKIIASGRDCFVEKPLTLDPVEAEKLVELARERNVVLMVGHLMNYHPLINKMFSLIQQDYIGDVLYVTSTRMNLGKFRREENVLWSFAPHDVSLILRLMGGGHPVEINCHGESFLTKGVYDITTTVMKWGDLSGEGRRGGPGGPGGPGDNANVCKSRYAQINVNWLNPTKEQMLVVVGEKGMFSFNGVENTLHYHPSYIQFNKGMPEPTDSEKQLITTDETRSPLELECLHFVECITNRTTPLTDGEEGLRVLKVLNSAQRCLEPPAPSPVPVPFVVAHKSAIVDADAYVGPDTKIWHFSHVASGARVGTGCNIGQNVFIAGVIGDNCKVQNNVSIYKGVEAGSHVFFGPSCVFTNDICPRAAYPKRGKYLRTLIGDGVTIGANATILCGIEIGEGAFIGAGAVVTRSVPPGAVVVGNPAKPIGICNEFGERTLFDVMDPDHYEIVIKEFERWRAERLY